MRTVLFLLLGLAVAGSAAQAHPLGAPRPAVLRDVEGYAIAVCLRYQTEPYQDQGEAWADVVIQRGKGPIEDWVALGNVVKREVAKGDMACVHRDETPAQGGCKAAPVLYCGEIIDTPSVRAAIQKTIVKLKPFYRRK